MVFGNALKALIYGVALVMLALAYPLNSLAQTDAPEYVFVPSDAVFVSTIGSLGSGNNQLNSPAGIVEQSGQIYVIDKGNDRILVLDPSGSYKGQTSLADLDYPAGIDVTDEVIYVTDSSSNVFVLEINGPPPLAFDVMTLPDRLTDVAVNNDKIIAVGNNNIWVLELFGEQAYIIETAGDDQFNELSGIATTDEEIFVLDSGNDKIYVFDPHNEYSYVRQFETSYGGTQFAIVDITADSGKIFATDNSNGKIQVFEINGTYVGNFGTPSINGTFFPTDIAVTSDEIFVSDNNNHKIHVFVIDKEYPEFVKIPSSRTIEATKLPMPLNATQIGVPTVSDDTDDSPVITNDAPEFPLGSTTVTWTVTDHAGKSNSTTQIITIQDTMPPVFDSIIPETYEATNVTSIIQLKAPDVLDADIDKILFTNDAPEKFPLGNTTVIWTATDSSGNSASASQIITVKDTMPPEFGPYETHRFYPETVPVDITYTPPNATDAVAAFVDCGPNPRTITKFGTTLLECTAHDTSGNVGKTHTRLVVIDPAINPDPIAVPSGFDLFFDDFEEDLTKWTMPAIDMWKINVLFESDPDKVAVAGSCNACIMSTSVDLYGHEWAYLEFDRFIDQDVKLDEGIRVELYNGTWNTIYHWSGDIDEDNDNAWSTQSFDLKDYLTRSFEIRVTAISNSQTLAIDDLRIVVPAKTVYDLTSTLTATLPIYNDYLGSSVDIHGNTMVVGAYGNDRHTSESGAVHVFTRTGDGWSEPVILTVDEGYWFGRTVAIYGDTIVASTRTADGGAVHVFTHANNTWAKSDTLSINGTYGVYFGRNVDIYEDTIVVGADVVLTSDTSPGSAYIFTRTDDSWSESQKIVASDGSRGDHFGWDVAIDKNTIIVGSFKNALYVFDVNNGVWNQTQKITSADSARYDYFGKRADIHENTIIVGATGDDDRGTNSGSAYIFAKNSATNSWEQVSKLKADDGARLDYFGNSVAIDDDTIIVGSIFHDSGAAYAFKNANNVWAPVSKLTVDDGQRHNWFGYNVQTYQNDVFVGSILTDNHMDDAIIYNSGAVYEYEPRIVPRLESGGASGGSALGYSRAEDLPPALDGQVVASLDGILFDPYRMDINIMPPHDTQVLIMDAVQDYENYKTTAYLVSDAFAAFEGDTVTIRVSYHNSNVYQDYVVPYE